jgi:plasmid replication initiation protein
MSDDFDLPVNTPETLGVTPRFVLKHNALSRGAHNLSATAAKLTAMAMALLPADMSSLAVSFTFSEFCKALGYSKGGESFKLFKKAIDECMDSRISIEMVSTKSGKRKWIKYTWFTFSELDEETGTAKMIFSNLLADALKEFRRMYSKINLKDLGELESRYAVRIFEIAVSYSSLAGKDGNKSGQWYFERDIPELRHILGVPEGAYSQTRDFRKKVIEGPIKDINEAGIGLEINTEGIKQGRETKKIRFNCTKASRTVTAADGKKSELADIELKSDTQKEAKELEHLKELYPEEFAVLYEEALTKHTFISKDSQVLKLAAEGAALTKLREKYGIVK